MIHPQTHNIKDIKFGQVKDNYAAWNINPDNFPKNAGIEEQISFIIRFGILAPSTHNTQPWSFVINKNILKISPNWDYRLPQADPKDRDLFISLGCCLTNILSAASYFNFSYSVSIDSPSKKDAFITAVFKKSREADDDLGALCPHILERYSNKLQYLDKPIDDSTIGQLQNINLDGISALLISDKLVIDNIASLHKRAMFDFSQNPLFRKELSSWLRFNNTDADDGMPGFVVGAKPLQTYLAKFLMVYFPLIFKLLSKKDESLIRSSPVIGVIVCEYDNVLSWINVGRVFEKLALKATSLGINIAIMDALIQNNKYTDELSKTMGIASLKPQIFFRLGYSSNASYHTPRRNLNKCLK